VSLRIASNEEKHPAKVKSSTEKNFRGADNSGGNISHDSIPTRDCEKHHRSLKSSFAQKGKIESRLGYSTFARLRVV